MISKSEVTIKNTGLKKTFSGPRPGKYFYRNDQLDMPIAMKEEFNSEIIKMVCLQGRKSLFCEEEEAKME